MVIKQFRNFTADNVFNQYKALIYRYGGPIIFPSLFHIGLRPIKLRHALIPLALGFEIKRKNVGHVQKSQDTDS